MSRLIFHVDVNSAYLSWEATRRVKQGEDDIRLIPSAIGGDREKRTGVILAKSIPAKKYGVKTGEPVGMALRKCPELFLAKPDFRLYEQCPRAFIEICKEYAPVVEQVSICPLHIGQFDFRLIPALHPNVEGIRIFHYDLLDHLADELIVKFVSVKVRHFHILSDPPDVGVLLLHAVLHELFDCDRVGSCSAGICRRVKRAVAGSECKALGIEHYAGQYRLCLAAQKLRLVAAHFKYLGHKLAHGRGIRLDEAEVRAAAAAQINGLTLKQAVVGRCLACELARQKVVACVAVGNFLQLTLLALTSDVLR